MGKIMELRGKIVQENSLGSQSSEQLVEFVMRADPKPNDCIPAPFANRPVLLIHADGPDVFVTAELFKT